MSFRPLALSTLGWETTIEHAIADTYPKWNSLCMLRAVGAPTLDAALIEPTETPINRASISEFVSAFASHLKTDRVMIRTDRHRETKEYVRGGNSYTLRDAPDHAISHLNNGRAVILLEPTIRYANKGTVSFSVDGNGNWNAEALGAGFDASDLQRSVTSPEYVCSGLPLDPCQIDRQACFAIAKRRLDSITMDERVRCRLEALERVVLPTSINAQPSQRQHQVKIWLQENGFNGLFEHRRFPEQLFRIALEVAQLTYAFRLKIGRRSSFVLSSSVLGDGRIVFWDVADGTRKWQS